MSAHRKNRAGQTHYNLLANNSPLGKIQLFDGKFCGLGNILWHTFNRNLFYTRVELRASCVCVLQGHNFPSSLSAAYTIVVVVVVRSILILHTGIFCWFFDLINRQKLWCWRRFDNNKCWKEEKGLNSQLELSSSNFFTPCWGKKITRIISDMTSLQEIDIWIFRVRV